MKEAVALQVMELSESVHTAHDDRLLLRGQKHEVGLTADWKAMTEVRTRDGRPVVVSYVLIDSDPLIAIKPETYEALPGREKPSYAAQPLRVLDLGDGATVEIRDNRVDLRLLGMWDSFGSRYRTALESMVEMVQRGVLRYSPRAQESERNLQEAIRNRLRRTMRPTEYEHDILFRGDIGRRIWSDLRESGKVNLVGDSTAYVSGFNRYKGQKSAVKFYDIAAREGLPAGEFFKIESTLFKGYFKSEGIDVRALTEQPNIQERIRGRLTKDIATVLRLCRGETLEALREETGADKAWADRRHIAIADSLLRRDDTLTGRVARLERDLEALRRDTDRRLRRLEVERERER